MSEAPARRGSGTDESAGTAHSSKATANPAIGFPENMDSKALVPSESPNWRNWEDMMDDLRKSILDYVRKEYLEEDDDRPLTETTRLISGGIVDSFSMVSLKRFLERKYDVKIPDADASPEAFDTVASIAALVERLAAVRA
jgi:acyl carrier protein